MHATSGGCSWAQQPRLRGGQCRWSHPRRLMTAGRYCTGPAAATFSDPVLGAVAVALLVALSPPPITELLLATMVCCLIMLMRLLSLSASQRDSWRSEKANAPLPARTLQKISYHVVASAMLCMKAGYGLGFVTMYGYKSNSKSVGHFHLVACRLWRCGSQGVAWPHRILKSIV